MKPPASARDGRVTGVIFDLDGVLVDSEPYWQQGFALIATEFLVELGLPDPGLTPAQMSRFQGGRVNDTMTAILDELGVGDRLDPTTVDALTDRVVDRVSEEFAADARPIHSSVAVARELADRGVPLAVASSSAQPFIEAALEAIGLGDAFAVTQSALDLEHGKPHPEVYLLTLQRLGLAAHEVLAIEDSVTGLTSALRADLATIWLLSGTDEPAEAALERLRDAAGADHLRTDLVRRVTHSLTIHDVEDVMGTP